MSGHSKWNNIKHKKEATDSKKAKVFSQMAKMIRIAVKEGKSADPQFNASLRLALEKARAVNMPKDKIVRSIERGLGHSASGQSLQSVTYEAFGSFGEAYMIAAMTDNVNRTSAEIKYLLSRAGASLGSPGSADHLFKRTKDGGFEAKIPLPASDDAKKKSEALMDQLRGLEDVEDVYCSMK